MKSLIYISIISIILLLLVGLVWYSFNKEKTVISDTDPTLIILDSEPATLTIQAGIEDTVRGSKTINDFLGVASILEMEYHNLNCTKEIVWNILYHSLKHDG